VKSLYVTDRAAAGEERLRAVLSSLAGAPNLSVQLREKQTPGAEALALARRCRQWLGPGVALYVNGRFDVAMAAGADGVHLPSDGLPLPRVRANTPRGFRIGVSTHSSEEARAAISGGADLVLIGPIFETPSKRDFGPPLTPQALADLPAAAEHQTEVFAIGGIAEDSLPQLDPYRDRIAGVAGVRMFQETRDPRALAERIARR
jgi:thiamine-phosphate pyrophosphorylase